MEVEIYYKRYGSMVLRRCRKLLGNEEMAQDVNWSNRMVIYKSNYFASA